MKPRHRVELLLLGTAVVLLGATALRVLAPAPGPPPLYDADAGPGGKEGLLPPFDPATVGTVRLINGRGRFVFLRTAEPGNRWVGGEGGFDPADGAVDALIDAVVDLAPTIADLPLPPAARRHDEAVLELVVPSGAPVSVALLRDDRGDGPVWARLGGREGLLLLPAPWRGRLGASREALRERRLVPLALEEIKEARWVEEDRMFAGRAGSPPVQQLLKLRAIEVVDPAPGHAQLDRPVARVEVDRVQGEGLILLVGGRAAGGGAWMQVEGSRDGLLVRERALDRMAETFRRAR